MKKMFLFIAVLMNLGFIMNAQTTAQRNLIRDFFESSEVCGLIALAHPSFCSGCSLQVVYIYDNTIRLEAIFNCGLVNVRCEYILNITDNGVFISLYKKHCGSATTGCFNASSVSDKIYSYMSRRNIAFNANHSAVRIQTEIKGKSFYSFTKIELAGCALFALWIERGYYRNY